MMLGDPSLKTNKMFQVCFYLYLMTFLFNESNFYYLSFWNCIIKMLQYFVKYF